jgi:hypothetical protein
MEPIAHVNGGGDFNTLANALLVRKKVRGHMIHSSCIWGDHCLTGLCGPLDELSDYESDSSCPSVPVSCNRTYALGSKVSPNGNTTGVKLHLRKQLNAANHRKQCTDRTACLHAASWEWKYSQTRHWSMPVARKCDTSFRGRPDLITETHPMIPQGATSSEMLKILQDHDYDLLHVE